MSMQAFEQDRERLSGSRSKRVVDAQEATVSLRWIVPFMRETGSTPAEISARTPAHIAVEQLANPQARVAHADLIALLMASVQHFEDPCLGLRAGERAEAGDYDVLENAARSCRTVRDALQCIGRFMPLLHGALVTRLVEDGEQATWQFRIVDDVLQPAAANDFVLSNAMTFLRRYVDAPVRPLAVHFAHDVATSVRECQRVFEGAALVFGKEHNALVFARSLLDAPMKQAHAGLHAAFALHATARLERLQRAATTVGRVRQLLVEELRGGDIGMTHVARRLGVSVPTLRRRLHAEDATYEVLLDSLRRELAESYLRETSLAISEITFMLGFAHVSGFYKAFARWSDGSTPSEFRARTNGRAPLSSSPPLDP